MVLVALKAQGLSLLGLAGHVALVALASRAQVPQGHLTWRVWSWRVCTRQGLACNTDHAHEQLDIVSGGTWRLSTHEAERKSTMPC
jgi:hypothetical protein